MADVLGAWHERLESELFYAPSQIRDDGSHLVVFRDDHEREALAWILEDEPKGTEGLATAIEAARDGGSEFLVSGLPRVRRVYHLGPYRLDYRRIADLPTFMPNCERGLLVPKSVVLMPYRAEEEVRAAFRMCHDAIYKALANDPAATFDLLLMIVAAKILDERSANPNYQFGVVRGESDEDRVDRLSALLERAEEWLDRSIGSRATVPWLPPHLATLIFAAFQNHSLLHTADSAAGTDVLGAAYETIVGATFRGELGSYFTPRNVADFMARVLNLSTGKVFDPACGSAGLLLAVKRFAGNEQNVAGKAVDCYGNDLNPRMVRAARVNFLLHGLNPDLVTHGDGLELDRMLAETDHGSDIEDGYWWDEVPVGPFDAVLANPPFAGHEQSPRNLGRIESAMTERGDIRSLNRTIPFLEVCVAALKTGGVGAVVIPTSVLNAEESSFRRFRDLLLEHVELLAIIGLPEKAFVHTDCGIHGALLFFKRVKKPRQRYNVYVDWAANLGYDRLGRHSKENDFPGIVDQYRSAAWPAKNTFPISFLKAQGRLDPAWLKIARALPAHDGHDTIALTDLVRVRLSKFGRRAIEDEATYRFFEVADTDMVTGQVKRVHEVTGYELRKKGRIKNIVRPGDVLMPNHRDSLIAKGAPTGRSAVTVDDELGEVLTTDRFLVLTPLVATEIAVQVLNSAGVRQQLVAQCRGAASLDIRERTLAGVRVPRALVEGLGGEQLIDRARALAEARAAVASLEAEISALVDEGFGVGAEFRPDSARVL